jgi:tetratricopeptide (TPR) repeat protein
VNNAGSPEVQAAQTKSAPLERHRRLSDSLLWTLQRNFYQRMGAGAWRGRGVPCHITSNTFIARAYARLITGFLRSQRKAIDPDHPVHVIELGAGHGRFGFLLLNRLMEECAAPELAGLRFRYLMTDVCPSNVEAWRQNRQLWPLFESEVMQGAVVDLERIEELPSADASKNPLIAIANYVFDSVPQDAFFVQDGELHENRISITSNRKEFDLDAAEALSSVQVSFSPAPAAAGYYKDQVWDDLLEQARRRLPAAHFLFPVAALRCIRGLKDLASDRLLLISADKGFNRDEAILHGQGAPGMVRHADGCFSMMVDYGVLGGFVERIGGAALHPGHPHESINVSAFVFGTPAVVSETRRAYREAIEDFGPDDFFTLTGGLERFVPAMSIEQSMAYLRLSGWDFRMVWTFLPLWKEHAVTMDDAQRREIRSAAVKVWRTYLPLGEEDDLAFNLGVLLLELGFYAEALEFLAHSEAIYGPEPGTAYNMGVCHYHLHDSAAALRSIDIALELNPAFDAAKALRILIESALPAQ